MKCVIFKEGDTQPGTMTVTLERGKTTLVFKNVPAQVCMNCGEAYVDDVTTKQLLAVVRIIQKTLTDAALSSEKASKP